VIVHADEAAVACTLVTGCSAHEVDKGKAPDWGSCSQIYYDRPGHHRDQCI